MGSFLNAVAVGGIAFMGGVVLSGMQNDDQSAPPQKPQTGTKVSENVPATIARPSIEFIPSSDPVATPPVAVVTRSENKSDLTRTFVSIVTAGEYYFVHDANTAEAALEGAVEDCKKGVEKAEKAGIRNIRVCDEKALLQQKESATDTRNSCATIISSERHWNVVFEVIVLPAKDQLAARSALGQQIKARINDVKPPLGYLFNEVCVDSSGQVDREKLSGDRVFREYNAGAYLEKTTEVAALPPQEKPAEEVQATPQPAAPVIDGIQLYVRPHPYSHRYAVLAKNPEAYITSVGIKIVAEKYDDGTYRIVVEGVRKQGRAYDALLQPEQYILMINDQSIRGMTFNQVVQALQGSDGQTLKLVLQPKYENSLSHHDLIIFNKPYGSHFSDTINFPYSHPEPPTAAELRRQQEIKSNWPEGPYLRCGWYLYENVNKQINADVMMKAGQKLFAFIRESPAEMLALKYEKVATNDSYKIFRQIMNGVTDMEAEVVSTRKWGGMKTFPIDDIIPVPANAETIKRFTMAGFNGCGPGSNLS